MNSIYLGGAIDLADEKSRGMFEEVAALIVRTIGPTVVVFNPFTAFRNANQAHIPRNDEYVVTINNTALLNADLAVFIWSGTVSFGVPAEIITRVQAGGPIFIFDTSGRKPGIYMRHQLAQVESRIVTTTDELASALVDHARMARTPGVVISEGAGAGDEQRQP